MEGYFDKSKYLDDALIEEIMNGTNLTKPAIQYWFRRERQYFKNSKVLHPILSKQMINTVNTGKMLQFCYVSVTLLYPRNQLRAMLTRNCA